MVRQLLAFSRRQTLTPDVIDLSRRLPEMKEMLSRSLRGDIETEVVVPDAPTAVKVDPSELELALLNLAVNAQDAMPNLKKLPATCYGSTAQLESHVNFASNGIPASKPPQSGLIIARNWFR